MLRTFMFGAAALALLTGCNPATSVDKIVPSSESPMSTDSTMDVLSKEFVRLALAYGHYDKNNVDAYTGDPAIYDAIKANPIPLETIKNDATLLLAGLNAVPDDEADPARLHMLRGDVTAMLTRIRMAEGETFTFNEETALLYDAVAPDYTLAEFDAAKAAMDKALPGEGTIAERAEALREALTLDADKMRPVMEAAIAECRRRTKIHYDLPEGERFDLEFVTDKPWSAYNWYKGDYVSLIEVNIDNPLTIDRAIELGCHEGYPGHHVYNVLAEQQRVRQKGWIENTVVPLFSPAGPIMEGSGNYGVPVAFPGDEKVKFEQEVLYPLAGIDPKWARISADVGAASARLDHVQTHVAREYLDGRMSREQAVNMLQSYLSRTRKRSEQSVDFIETYRGYVINYALGQDVVRDWVKMKEAQGLSPWDAFAYILETPVTVSQLQADIEAAK